MAIPEGTPNLKVLGPQSTKKMEAPISDVRDPIDATQWDSSTWHRPSGKSTHEFIHDVIPGVKP
ncbi:uncharacterized protein N7483_012968 [Penicillium malachiteum]|uniref:uncharacterized protein n=1 Tax=Penicillium malachiteum TaxID=1324776 RepID=UPI0025490615|nr:uncharacterized protein N7483_012968 [Penicillium malachiteum]KAJ5715787.1 hypothetical protein N7483_012968 [Penicillium malachiteum]